MTHLVINNDLIIKLVAKRLESLIDLNYTLARIGGDEFAILIPEIKLTSTIDVIATDIINTMSEPFKIDEQLYILSVSVGISIYPRESVTAEDMMTHADAAMYKAKERA